MGRFWIENELIDHHLDKISGNELKVLLTVTRYYNKQGTCYPSIRMMSKKIKLNHETIGKCLKRLELLGFFEQIVIKERMKLRYIFSKTATNIFLNPPKLLQKPDSKEVYKEFIKEREISFKPNYGMEKAAEILKRDYPKNAKEILKNRGITMTNNPKTAVNS